jgi:sulfur carrier protein ThiS
MKVKVKLYGTLSKRFPGYQPSQGIEVELPNGATPQDLLTHLEIPESLGAVVIAEGRIQKADDEIPKGVAVNVVQPIGGG